ncbi:MAG: hypothetical protein HY011_07430 [Acidobacteria bacterium]|nr:hypothetical protein [Acidobacteriota bacterium]
MLQASWLVIKKLPDVFESRAQLAILTKPSDETQSLAAQIAALTQRAVSRESLAPLIKTYKLNKGDEDLEATATRLRKEIKIEIKLRQFYPEFPETILVSYRHTDPEIAKQVVADMVANFTDTNESLRQQAAKEIKDIELQLGEMESPLGKISSQRLATLRSQTTATGGAALEDPRILRRTLLSEINALNDKQFQLDKQIALQQQQIAEQQTVAKSATVVASGATANSSYGVLITKKAELDAQVKEFEKQYTNENPKLKQARAQAQELNLQIEKMERSTPGSQAVAATPEGRELRGLERELERQKTELAITQRNLESKRQELANLPNAGPSAAAPNSAAIPDPATDAEYERLSKRYIRLLDKQEALQQATNNMHIGPNLNLFRVIDPAFLPSKPAAPNRTLLKLIALGLALGMGLLTVAVLEARQFFRIQDERDVEYYLGAPVMGLIPETLTPVEHSLMRRQKVTRVALVVIIVAACVPIFALLLNGSGLFEVLGNK